MSWIKRNLYFLIGSVVAVALLGLAGFYCFNKWNLNNSTDEELAKAYGEWEQIKNPANDKVNNIDLAREYQKKAQAEIQKVAAYFDPIPPVPNSPDGAVTAEAYASALRRTLDQLQRVAESGSVTLPTSQAAGQTTYDFSFTVQRTLAAFSSGSLKPLAGQLGDIKAICDILFAAKINSFDSILRERVGADDQSATAPQSDYLDPSEISVTNTMAILVPYEVTIHCFSAELGNVMAGFANSRHGIMVKAINVEPGNETGVTPGSTPGTMPGEMPPGMSSRYAQYFAANQQANPYLAQPAANSSAKGPPTVLDEKQLKITLVLNVVKLLHPK